MAPEMAPGGDRFFAQVHHLFERNLAYRTSNISANSSIYSSQSITKRLSSDYSK